LGDIRLVFHKIQNSLKWTKHVTIGLTKAFVDDKDKKNM
jgi:hypothetical protein